MGGGGLFDALGDLDVVGDLDELVDRLHHRVGHLPGPGRRGKGNLSLTLKVMAK